MSGNPFRRPQVAVPSEQPAISNEQDVDSGVEAASTTSKTKSGKPKKRVQIVSPPQSPVESPHFQRRISDGASGSPPPPPLTAPVGEEVQSNNLELQQAVENTRRNSNGSDPLPPPVMQATTGPRAPYNPFARTLATSEAAFGLQNVTAEEQEKLRHSTGGPPKMNVDMFKNILMTGSASPSPPVASSSRSQRPQDSSSSTDTSSVSRQSLFDHSHDFVQESPRTSFDQASSSDEDEQNEHSSLMGPSGTRPEAEAPPPPPKHTHGKSIRPKGPQTVSFADFHESIPSGWQQPPGPRTPPPGSSPAGILRPSTPRSPSDLNKPLPQPPEGSSRVEPNPTPVPEMMASIQPPTPITENEEPQAKRAPPPPPSSRRQAQSSHGRSRSGSNLTQNSIQEEDETASSSRIPTLQPKLPPPPPPSRRAQIPTQPQQAIETASSPSPTPTNENKPMPPPPPRRHQSKSSTTSITRTPSNASRTSLTRSSDTPAPPAPPPRRTGSGRNSLDGVAANRRWSGQSETSSLRQVDEGHGEPAPQRDVLADLAALQAEVDALRKAQQGQQG